MACTLQSLWQDNLCWVSTIVTTTAEALSLGSPWKRNRPSGIIPPNGSTLFHRPKGDKCREWEKTPVRNGMRIKPGRRRMVFLLLSWWVRTIPRVLNNRLRNLSPDLVLTLPSWRRGIWYLPWWFRIWEVPRVLTFVAGQRSLSLWPPTLYD